MLARSVFVASLSCSVLFAACGGEEFSAGGGSAGAGAGGSGAAAGAGGAGAASAGADPGGTAGTGGRATGGTAGTTVDGGIAGAGSPDSGTAGSGGQNADACALESWFPDEDEDGYGRSSGVVQSCERPEGAYAEDGGDCNDDNRDVFPGQTKYFDQPYQTGSGTHSFDYDCSQTEDPDPSQYGAAPTDCTLLSAGGCSGQGFVPTTRDGSGVNVLCGSKTLRACVWETISCKAVESSVSAKRCH